MDRLSDLNRLLLGGAHGLDQVVFAGGGQPVHGSVVPPFHLSRVYSLIEPYYMKELRSWLSDDVDSSVAVMVSFSLDRIPTC